MQKKIPPPLYGIIFALAMWALDSLIPSLQWLPNVGLLILLPLAIGLAAISGALTQFIRSKTTPDPFRPDRASTLVVSGFYQFSRNPMYFGLLMFLLSWALYLGNILSLLCLPVFIRVLTNQQIKFEEEALIELFGEQYEQYMQRVRRWI
ncbi:MAG: isoprenylcysteine carboxyl methyltransferase [Gammaproteobacteria bacterium]|nr:MAG: isoprenylcysteine carboxyl methyltransferase [Gammaproteobacteria bacterium]